MHCTCWHLSGTLAAPCWHPSGTLLAPFWHPAGTLLAPCWHLLAPVGTMCNARLLILCFLTNMVVLKQFPALLLIFLQD
jgi:hypothetical protein